MGKYKIPRSSRTFMRKYPRRELSKKTLERRYKRKKAGIRGKRKPKKIKLPKAKTMKEVRAERRLKRKAIKKATNELAKKMSKKAARKLAGKLVLKFGVKLILKVIPIVGWISLAWEVFDVVQLARAYEASVGKVSPEIKGGEEAELEKLIRTAKFTKMPPDEMEAINKSGLSFNIKNRAAGYKYVMTKVSEEKVLVIKKFFIDKSTIKEEEPPINKSTIKELKESNHPEKEIELVKKGQAKVLKGTFFLIYQIIGKRRGFYIAPIYVYQIVPVEEKKMVAPRIKRAEAAETLGVGMGVGSQSL